MDMRVRGKRPHGRNEVGGPTLKTSCLESVGVGNPEVPDGSPRGASRVPNRPARARFFCERHRRLYFGSFADARAELCSFRRAVVQRERAFDFAAPRCKLRRPQPSPEQLPKAP